jgi:thiol-disulfide isomerase/thioredoxin
MRYALLALLTLITTFVHALEVGEAAPSLASVTWVKNGPVEIGRSLTVVELWATWCGPCHIWIPKLSALSTKYQDRLIVVGLSDEEVPTITKFVAAQGPTMNYHVGKIDDTANQGYKIGSQGLPYTFLIGADGKVIWHGHPMALKKIVAAVLDGTWDAKAEAQRAQQREELQALLNTDPAGNENALIARIQEKTALILAADPLDQETLGLRLNIAKHQKDAALFRATLAAIPVGQLEAEYAIELTMTLIKDEQPASRHLDLAYAFAQRAVSAEPTSADAHAALASVWHGLGYLDRARASQERAVAIDPADNRQLATLAFYREVQRLAGLISDGKPLTAPAASSVPKPAPAVQPASPAGPASLVP